MGLKYRNKPCDKTKRQDPNSWSKEELEKKCKSKFGESISSYKKYTKEELCKALKDEIPPKELFLEKKKEKKKVNKELRDSLAKFTIAQLKEMLKKRKLKVSGKKEELIERLRREAHTIQKRESQEDDEEEEEDEDEIDDEGSDEEENEDEEEEENRSKKNKKKEKEERDSNNYYTRKLLNDLSDDKLYAIASKLELNTSVKKEKLISQILEEYESKQDPEVFINIKDISDRKMRELFLYLKSLSREELKHISNKLNINNRKKSNIILILQILSHIDDNKLKIEITDLEALAESDTKILEIKKDEKKKVKIDEKKKVKIDEKKKVSPTIKELYPKLCEMEDVIEQYKYLKKHYTTSQIDELTSKFLEKYKQIREIKLPSRYKFDDDIDKKNFYKYIVFSRLTNLFMEDPRHEEIYNLYLSFQKNGGCYPDVFSRIKNIRKDFENNDDENDDDNDDEENKVKFDTKKCINKSKIPLTDYQKNAVKFALDNRGTLLYFETGTGKTLTAVTFSQCILRNEPNRKIVVITPKSLQINFKNEIKKYGGDPNDKRYKFYTYDEVVNKYKESPDNPTFAKDKVLIIDEAHKLRTEIKMGEGKRSRKNTTPKKKGVKANVLVNGSKLAYKVMLLTATPFYNKVSDGLNLLNLLRKTKVDKMSDDELIQQLARHTIYQGKLNDADFPAVEYVPINIYMDNDYYQQYQLVESKQNLDYKNPWRFLNGVRRAMNKIQESPSQKIQKAYELVKESLEEGKKCLLFTSWLAKGIELLEEKLSSLDDAKIAIITGKTTKNNRAAIVEKYNKRKYNVLIISAAGGEGLDLKEVETVIVLDALWSEAAFSQVEGRAVRKKSHVGLPPSRRKVVIYSLYMQKPKNIYRTSAPSADELMKIYVEQKTEELNFQLEQLQKRAIENGHSSEQVRASSDQIATPPKASSFVMQKSPHAIALQNARLNAKL